MPCSTPLRAWIINPLYGSGMCFKVEESLGYAETLARTGSKALAHLQNPYMHVPCRKCINCRIANSREWAVRMQHEAQMHDNNSFLTLTINDANLLSRPNPFTLDKKEHKDFFKRLRHHLYPEKVRYFVCGEYGDLKMRPHYHAILFGHAFPDRKYFKTVRGNPVYTSEMLSSVWPQGFAVIQDVTFDSAAYVARYITKKMSGPLAKERYIVTDPYTGETWERVPDYSTQSSKPGIGADWIKKYKSDVYPADRVVVKTPKGIFEMRPPKYYDKFIPEEMLEELKVKRTEHAQDNQLSEERLSTIHELSIHRQKRVVRDITNDESIYK